jgi:PAS domain S-box-containing protein
MRPRLLVVDDETRQMEALRQTLEPDGYDVAGFTSPAEALEALRGAPFDVLLTDLMMPGMDGITFLRAALEIDPDLVGIVMTGHGTVPTAVDAMKVGALDYIVKPFTLSAIRPVLSRALDLRRLRLENIRLREAVGIYELSSTIARTLDAGTILERVADAAFQQSRACEVLVFVDGQDEGALRMGAIRTSGALPASAPSIPVSDELLRWADQAREWLDGLDEESAAQPPPVPGLDERASRIALPMFVGGRLAGVLTFRAMTSSRPVSSGQIRALSVLASAGAAALEVATLIGQIRTAEARYRRLAEHAPDVIFRYERDPQPGFAYVNPAIDVVTGYSPEQFYTERSLAARIVHPEDRNLFEAAVGDDHAEGRTLTLRWMHRSGAVVWIEQRIVPVRDATGRTVAVEGIARDVTERRRMETALRRTNEDLRQFAWAASHDLQEPLRMIALYTELLARTYRGTLDERADELVSYAADGARRILGMVRELRAFVEAGDEPADPHVSADANRAFDAAVADLRADLDACRAQVVSEPLPHVRMKAAHLSDIFRRLLDNALKFRRSADAPRIEVSAERSDGVWIISVLDCGIGIDPAYHAQIFEVFRRLNRREDFAGHGMGLPVCRRIVEAYGGRLWVESKDGQGSRFRFTVPSSV